MAILRSNRTWTALLLSIFSLSSEAFVNQRWGSRKQYHREFTTSASPAHSMFNKLFEESGPLGKGTTVGKVQVALNCPNRSRDSIIAILERATKNPANTNYDLADLAHQVCLALLRKSADWTAAASESDWFSQNDGGKAEAKFNAWANKEATKFEKEYIPGPDSDEKSGGPTQAVVSLIVEIEGDETIFDGAGYSMAKTEDVLNSIAANVLVEDGDCVSAVEVFWTPGERDEVLTSRDLIVDFPELVTL